MEKNWIETRPTGNSRKNWHCPDSMASLESVRLLKKEDNDWRILAVIKFLQKSPESCRSRMSCNKS